MKNIKVVFRNLEKKLKNSNWFKNDWGIYNRGDYLQLYKNNWYNENQGGIHFETFIEAPQIKQKVFPICMHAEKDCPSQQLFIKKFLELEDKRIRLWKGYNTIGKGYSIFQRILPLNYKNLEDRLFEEFNQLRKLDNSIEKTLYSIK